MYIVICDVVRYATVIVSGVLIACLGRLLFLRLDHAKLHDAMKGRPNPASIAGTILLLSAGLIRRLDTIGEPGDWFLWAFAIAVTLIAVGTFRNLRFHLPWTRRHR